MAGHTALTCVPHSQEAGEDGQGANPGLWGRVPSFTSPALPAGPQRGLQGRSVDSGVLGCPDLQAGSGLRRPLLAVARIAWVTAGPASCLESGSGSVDISALAQVCSKKGPSLPPPCLSGL